MADIPSAEIAPGAMQPSAKKNVLTRVRDRILGRPNTTSLSEQQQSKIQFKRETFVTQQKTDISKERGAKGKEFTGAYEWVAMTESVKNQYRRLLEQYTHRLIKVQRENPDVLRNQEHIVDRQLLERLTTRTVKELEDKTVEQGLSLNQEKINKFLETPEGWILANQLLEQEIAMKLFALGLHASASHQEGFRARRVGGASQVGAPRNEAVRIDVDEGTINRLYQDHLAPYIDPRSPRFRLSNRRTVGAGAAGGALGALFGQRIAGAAGAGVGAGIGVTSVYGAYQGLKSLMKDGMIIDLRQCTAALQVIQGNQAEAQYVYAMHGIDVNQFMVTGNTVALNPDRIPETTRTIQVPNTPAFRDIDPVTLKRELLENMYTRLEFFQNLKVPHQLLDALPEQFLYQFSAGQQEQTGVVWQQEIQDAFEPNNGGVRDLAGNFRNNSAFNPANLDFEGNLQRFMTARREVMMRRLRDMVRESATGIDPAARRIDLLGKHKTARGEGGEIRQRSIRESGQRKTALEGDRTRHVTEKGVLETHRTALRELQELRGRLANEFPTVTNIDREIERLNNSLTGTGARSIVRREVDIEEQRLQATITAANNSPIPPGRRPNYDTLFSAAKKSVDPLYDAQINILNNEKARIQTQINTLTELKDGIRSKEQALADNTETVRNLDQNLRVTEGDYRRISGWGIIDADLLTLSVNDLLTRINAQNTTNPAFGWPEGQNNLPENRQRLIHAMIGARTSWIANALPDAVIRSPDFQTVLGFNISENQLRILPVGELERLLMSSPATGWTATDRPRLLNAIQYAQDSFNVRVQVYDQLEVELEEAAKREENFIAGVNFEQDIRRIETTERVLGTQPKMFERLSLIQNPADLGRYTDLTPVNPADTSLTANERALHNRAQLPVGYLNLMDMVFDYQGSDRNEYFARILEFMPPQRFAELMRDFSDLSPALAGVTDINSLLFAMQMGFNNGDFTEIELIPAFRNVINRVSDETLGGL